MTKQREIVTKLRDALAKYTALDLKAYLDEAAERRVLREEEQLREQLREQKNNQSFVRSSLLLPIHTLTNSHPSALQDA
jgi:hypothetical protein